MHVQTVKETRQVREEQFALVREILQDELHPCWFADDAERTIYCCGQLTKAVGDLTADLLHDTADELFIRDYQGA
jgi:hypothetical protein